MTASAVRARPRARWIVGEAPSSALVATLAAELRLPDSLCQLLVQRGFADPESAKRYLRPRLDQLHDPADLPGMGPAVDRLVSAARSGERILVHGDYDVDGICSTVVLLRTLRRLGADALPFIPRRREDGYDLSSAGVSAAIAAGARVLITCDCGTNAVEAIAAACAAGLDVIVTDHHLPGGALPDCIAIINPRRPDCSYPDSDLAGVGVAFKLAQALVRACGASEDALFEMLDLVALATTADLAPLRGENRVLVRHGLRRLAATTNVGLRALLRSSGLEGKAITAGRVGYTLAPRLNAVGRLGHALRGVQLLMTSDEHEANAIARELEELNQRRQQLDRSVVDDAMTMIDRLDLERTAGIVLAREGWHPGVVGIAAARVLEAVCRPVVLVALEDGVGRGSGRSIPAFDLHGGLEQCRDLLMRFGGHRMAAGVTVTADQVPALAERFNAVATAQLTADDLVPTLRVDLELPLADVTPDLERLLRHFEPFGIGNPAPVFLARGVQLGRAPRVVGRGHLKLSLAADGAELEAIGWDLGGLAEGLDRSAPLDVAFRVECDTWGGEPRLQAKLADLRQ